MIVIGLCPLKPSHQYIPAIPVVADSANQLSCLTWAGETYQVGRLHWNRWSNENQVRRGVLQVVFWRFIKYIYA